MPLEEEVMTRFASKCPNIKQIELIDMSDLSEEERMQFCCLFRHIIQQNPPLDTLNLQKFSDDGDKSKNVGEYILETILNSRI